MRVGTIMLPRTFKAHLIEDEHGGPDVTLAFEVRNGAVECRAVHINATPEGHEVRVTGLAGIRVQDVLEQTVQGLMYVQPRSEEDVTAQRRASDAFAEDLPWVPPHNRPKVHTVGENYAIPLTVWNESQLPDGDPFDLSRGNDRTVRLVRAARTARKVTVTESMLREVAAVYRANVGDKPTQAVAEHFDKAHRTAALYVKQAREAGFLGKATKGKAGEQ